MLDNEMYCLANFPWELERDSERRETISDPATFWQKILSYIFSLWDFLDFFLMCGYICVCTIGYSLACICQLCLCLCVCVPACFRLCLSVWVHLCTIEYSLACICQPCVCVCVLGYALCVYVWLYLCVHDRVFFSEHMPTCVCVCALGEYPM